MGWVGGESESSEGRKTLLDVSALLHILET